MSDKLSEHFTKQEFECKCGCGFCEVDSRLLVGLEHLRQIINAPIHVNSGCRCKAHNASLSGSSPNSQHMLGRAADIVVKGLSPGVVSGIADSVPEFWNGGIGTYSTFTHVDVRSGRARWAI